MNYIPSELWKHLPFVKIEYLCGFLVSSYKVGPYQLWIGVLTPYKSGCICSCPWIFGHFYKTHVTNHPKKWVNPFASVCQEQTWIRRSKLIPRKSPQSRLVVKVKVAGSFWCWRCHEIRQKGAEINSITPRSPKSIILLGTYHQQFQGTIWFFTTSRDHPFFKGWLLKIQWPHQELSMFKEALFL